MLKLYYRGKKARGSDLVPIGTKTEYKGREVTVLGFAPPSPCKPGNDGTGIVCVGFGHGDNEDVVASVLGMEVMEDINIKRRK